MAINGGHKSKFMERLFNMVKFRVSKKNIESDKESVNNTNRDKGIVNDRDNTNNDKFIRERVNYIRKRISSNNNVRNNKGISNTSVKDNNKKVSITKDKKRDSFIEKTINDIRNNNDRVGVVSKYKGIGNNDNNDNKVSDNKKDKVNINEDNIKKLEKKIIKKISNKLDKSLCELDVLESEIYLLGKDNDKELELDKIKEIRKKIEEINKKIEHIKKQYEILKSNYYFEDILEMDDNILIDDIIDYKYMIDNMDSIYEVNSKYKLLDEYRDLFSKLEDIDNLKDNLVESNNKYINDYEKRDIRYNKIKDDITNVDSFNKGINYEIEKQNEYMNNLLSKVNIINKNEYDTFKIKGLGEMISNSLKYVGLLMISPLVGFIPSIAINTIATRKLIGNIRKNMKIEYIKKVNYTAINYDNEIREKLNDVDYVDYIIGDAMNDISSLKKEFMSIYNSNINGYESTLNKIEKLEKNLINNKRKVTFIRERLNYNRKTNKDKLSKVKKLNEVSNK